MKKLNPAQMQNLNGGRFWGKDCGPDFRKLSSDSGGPLPTQERNGNTVGACPWTCTRHIFWIKVTEFTEEANCDPWIF